LPQQPVVRKRARERFGELLELFETRVDESSWSSSPSSQNWIDWASISIR
jgi:hypothetical protein